VGTRPACSSAGCGAGGEGPGCGGAGPQPATERPDRRGGKSKGGGRALEGRGKGEGGADARGHAARGRKRGERALGLGCAEGLRELRELGRAWPTRGKRGRGEWAAGERAGPRGLV
jgi:hypothetical protein